ncbi:MAG: 3-phosphoshikimate 1-carboxyvinyltransferase [Dehalococcoidales bacterium]
MKIVIEKSRIAGRISAPPSKSYTIRALMCAALAGGESEIRHPLTAEDTVAAADVLREIGIATRREKESWRVSGGGFRAPETDLFCGDSAATLRFLTAMCSVVPGRCRLVAGSSLAKRPVGVLVRALKDLGVDCAASGGLPPVTVGGGTLRGGLVEIPGDVSSQFISALLLVAPRAENGMTIRLTTPLESGPYIRMTLDCLQKFGITVGVSGSLDEFQVNRQTYQPAVYQVEGDWSSVSYFLALGAVAGRIEITNLDPDSAQGDKMMLTWLRDMGAAVEINRHSVTVARAKLKALRADLTDCIDLLPTLAVLAAVAQGTSEFTGIVRARLKESNRVTAVKDGLERMGVRVIEETDKLTIVGSVIGENAKMTIIGSATGSPPHGAVIDSMNDHRIAMAFSVLVSVVGGTVIEGAECVNKTFPQFWDILESAGGKLKTDGE